MKPDPTKVGLLVDTLKELHGSRFQALQIKGIEFARGLTYLANFKVIVAGAPRKHAGRVIVDGVLQVGHDYEKQVKPRVNRISKKDQAAIISGFMNLIESKPLKDIIGWHENAKNDLQSVALFFQEKGVDTFDELYNWLESEDNRDKLLTKNSGFERKGSVFRVADKTADYFRVLVGHWDAVAVDRGIKELFAKTKVLPRYSTRYTYKEKRAIVQLAALDFDCTPRDLDRSLYCYNVEVKTTTQPTGQ